MKLNLSKLTQENVLISALDGMENGEEHMRISLITELYKKGKKPHNR